MAFVAAIVMATGIQVFNAQKTEALSEVAMANVEALAADDDLLINPFCKNGCIEDGDGCFCYHDYSDYKEAPWP